MLAPRARVAFLMNPSNPNATGLNSGLKRLQAAAPKGGDTILPMEASTPQEIETAFAAMSRGKAGAVIVQGDGFFIRQPLLIDADKVIE